MFHEFDAAKVPVKTPTKVDRLTGNPRAIRNRRRLEVVVNNALKILELDPEFSGFQKCLRSHADFPGLVKDLRKQIEFLGAMGCYYSYVVGEEVPGREEGMASIKK